MMQLAKFALAVSDISHALPRPVGHAVRAALVAMLLVAPGAVIAANQTRMQPAIDRITATIVHHASNVNSGDA